MYAAYRFIVALVAVLTRLVAFAWPRGEARTHDGHRYLRRAHADNRGRVKAVQIRLPVRSQVVCKVALESAFDRWLNAVGLAESIQTGNRAYDHWVAVTSDHPDFATRVRESLPLRLAVARLLNHGFSTILVDGRQVVLKSKNGDLTERVSEDALVFVQELKLVASGLRSRLVDGFLWRAVLVEGVAWAFVYLAAEELVSYATRRQDVHLDGSALLLPGVFLGIGLFVSLAVLLGVIMRGRAKGHRILIESYLLLLVSAPIVGVQTVSGYNRELDQAPSIKIDGQITGMEDRRLGGKSGRLGSDYYLGISSGALTYGIELPPAIRVAPELFERARVGDGIRLEIAPGELGFPWYRRVELLPP